MSIVASILESFGQALPPGSTVYVFAAQLPDGRSMMHAEALPANGAPLARSAGSLVLAPPTVHAQRVRETPLDRVVALRTEHGADTPLKLRDWTAEAGLSVRELKRAIKHGALIAERKPDGRDNKALMITIGAVENYLRTVAAVERAEEDPPVWWNDVRGSRAAA